ncbi:MAG: hypothetical protein U0326_40915 [Polyangiales bacterium]
MIERDTTWFIWFVEETVELWLKRVKNRREAKDNPEDIYDLSNTDLGGIAEDSVVLRFEDLGYLATRTPGSRTPADVYAIQWTTGGIHISLVQVKSTRGDVPKQLRDEAIQMLLALARFVSERLHQSNLVPFRVKQFRVVISAGYAGLIVGDIAEDDTCDFTLFSTEVFHRLPDRRESSWRQRIESAHALGGIGLAKRHWIDPSLFRIPEHRTLLTPSRRRKAALPRSSDTPRRASPRRPSR